MVDIKKSLTTFLATPLALSEEGLLHLESKLEALATLEVDEELTTLMAYSYKPKLIEDLPYNPDTKIGQINVTGVLIDKYDPFLSWYFDATSYQELVDDVRTMLEAGAETIIQYNDSGGGMAYGMMESSSLVREMLDSYKAKMIVYSDGISASAAYGWAVVGDEIISNPDSELGSVGVVISLTDYSKYMEDLGIKRVFITAGKGKVPYNVDGSFTQEFLTELQEKVDVIYDKFVSHVSSNRPITSEKLIEVGAKVLTAENAVSIGMADAILTRNDFSNYLADIVEKKGYSSMSFLDKFTTKPKTEQEDINMSDKNTESVEAKLESLKTELQAGYNKDLEAALEAARTEFTSQLAIKDAELAEVRTALEVAQKEKKEATASKRTTELTTVVGEARAKELVEALSDLSDEKFAQTVKVFTSTKTDKDETFLQEFGSEGDEVTPEETEATAPRSSYVNAINKKFPKQ